MTTPRKLTTSDGQVNLAATAAALVVAVSDRDPIEIGTLLGALERRDLAALCVQLAGHVNVDAPFKVHSLTPHRTIELCITAAAEAYGLTPAALRSGSRRHEVIDARHVAAHAAHLCGASYSQTGRQLGGRDHSTIINAVSRVGTMPHLRRVAVQIADRVGRAPLFTDPEAVSA